MKKDSSDEVVINRWWKYKGCKGPLRYLISFLLGGMTVFPIVLTGIEPTVWGRLQKSSFDHLLGPCLVVISLLGTIGFLLWKCNQQPSTKLKKEQNRYSPFEKRVWRSSERNWRIVFSIMTFLVSISLFFSFGLLLVHNAPDYFTYPFQATIAYSLLYFIYGIFMYWRAIRYGGEWYVPVVFKIGFTAIFIVVVATWGRVMIH